MAASRDQTGSDLVHEHGQMIQDLMKQQAEAEEAFSYQIRDLQKQIIGIRKQRATDAEHYNEETDSLRKQLASAALQTEGLQGQVPQLTKDVRTSATDAATDVLDQYNKTAERMPNFQSNKYEERVGQIEKAVAGLKRDIAMQQDEADVQFESIGSRLRQLKDDIYAINQESAAKVVAESDLKGRTVVKMRNRIDEVEGHMKNIGKTTGGLMKRLESLESDVDHCKTTFYFFNEATKYHVERKSL